jgi:hypothetical protein
MVVMVIFLFFFLGMFPPSSLFLCEELVGIGFVPSFIFGELAPISYSKDHFPLLDNLVLSVRDCAILCESSFKPIPYQE